MRRTGEATSNYDLSITSSLSKRDATLKSKINKQRSTGVLSTFRLGENVMMQTRDDGTFGHDEANSTMVSYIMQAVMYGKDSIYVVSDDTDVFVLLVYWVHTAALHCKVQMERWNGTVLQYVHIENSCLQKLMCGIFHLDV